MKTVIFGNGAMARVVHSYARQTLDVAGFTVDDAVCGAAEFCGLPLVPFSRAVAAFPPDRHRMLTAVGFLEMNRLRLRKVAEARAMGFGFARYIHPSVMEHDGVQIGENAVILDHVSIHPGSRVGESCFLSSNVNIGHDCRIGEGCWINAGVAIAGGCDLGARGFLGVNASLGQDVRLGEGCFIGANTLVTRSAGAGEVHLSAAGEKFRLGSDAFLAFSGMVR